MAEAWAPGSRSRAPRVGCGHGEQGRRGPGGQGGRAAAAADLSLAVSVRGGTGVRPALPACGCRGALPDPGRCTPGASPLRSRPGKSRDGGRVSRRRP